MLNFKQDKNTFRYDLPIEVLIAGMFSIMLMCSAVLEYSPAVIKHVKVAQNSRDLPVFNILLLEVRNV